MGGSTTTKVAVVGGGLTGIASAWALQASGFDVHLFEASPRLGGHMRTRLLECDGNQFQVDGELPTYNPSACPNLISLLRYFGISTSAVPFSFGILDDGPVFKWYTDALETISLYPRLLCRIETYRLLLDVISLRYLGADVLSDPRHEDADNSGSTESYLEKNGYSESFRDKYLTPLLSTLWGSSARRYLPSLPIRALTHALSSHHLLYTCVTTPEWRLMDPGVRNLIEAMVKNIPLENQHLRTKVAEITRLSKSQFDLATSSDRCLRFDHIILAVDGDEILRLLGPIVSGEEKDALGCLGATKNIAVLYSDSTKSRESDAFVHHLAVALPDRRDPNPPKSDPKYNVNQLQSIPASRFGNVFIILNPSTPPHPNLVEGVWEFTEPEPSAESLDAQARLTSIQKTSGLSYGFCWTGRGPLEDAITSGLRMAVQDLKAKVPFRVVFHPQPLDTTAPIHKRSNIQHNLLKTILQLLRTFVLVVEIILLLFSRFHPPGSRVRARLGFRGSRTLAHHVH